MWDRDSSATNSSPTRILETVHRQNLRQFTDRFEVSSPTKKMYMYIYGIKGKKLVKTLML